MSQRRQDLGQYQVPSRTNDWTARSRTFREQTGLLAPLQNPFPKTGRSSNLEVSRAWPVIDQDWAPGKTSCWSRHDPSARGASITTAIGYGLKAERER
jgi:hypothetical protein